MQLKINDLVGIPYAERGRTLTGADCWGLIYLAFKHVVGTEVPSYDHQYEHVNSTTRDEIAALIQQERRDWVPVRAGAEQRYDCISVLYGDAEMHVGMVVSPGRMLHMSRLPGKGSVVERYRSPVWAPRIQGFYRYVV